MCQRLGLHSSVVIKKLISKQLVQVLFNIWDKLIYLRKQILFLWLQGGLILINLETKAMVQQNDILFFQAVKVL